MLENESERVREGSFGGRGGEKKSLGKGLGEDEVECCNFFSPWLRRWLLSSRLLHSLPPQISILHLLNDPEVACRKRSYSSAVGRGKATGLLRGGTPRPIVKKKKGKKKRRERGTTEYLRRSPPKSTWTEPLY